MLDYGNRLPRHNPHVGFFRHSADQRRSLFSHPVDGLFSTFHEGFFSGCASSRAAASLQTTRLHDFDGHDGHDGLEESRNMVNAGDAGDAGDCADSDGVSVCSVD